MSDALSGRPGAGIQVPAGMGMRVLARVIDLVIVGSIGLVVSAAVSYEVPVGSETMMKEFLASLVSSLILFVLYAGYEVAFTALYGATPGKLFCGLRIAMSTEEEDGSGGPADALGVLKRSTVLYLSVLLNFVPVIGLLALGVSIYAVTSAFLDQPRGRGLHDRLGGTEVVTTRERPVSSEGA
ncbi:putative RDD family membrane protein YckC [Nocardiopsis mwathae]|uniref:Putative RDD family membrane protein YckC n=1 Tax=Nocardiopsis mwathae TaxID=1472723 RepID=A0A7W9YFA5_9ACTN|nr:RDD family protein [Nocardiopsis mwathae]MBB6171118.1 putative RDD family membrane protein YckC [Nocardiopsis mwathae]